MPTNVDLPWCVAQPEFGDRTQHDGRPACDQSSDGVRESLVDRSKPLPSSRDVHMCDGPRSYVVRSPPVVRLADDDRRCCAGLSDGDVGHDYVGECAMTTPNREDFIYGQGKTQIQPRKCLEPAREDAAIHTDELKEATIMVDWRILLNRRSAPRKPLHVSAAMKHSGSNR